MCHPASCSFQVRYIMVQESFNIFRLSTSNLMEIGIVVWIKFRTTCRTIGMEL